MEAAIAYCSAPMWMPPTRRCGGPVPVAESHPGLQPRWSRAQRRWPTPKATIADPLPRSHAAVVCRQSWRRAYLRSNLPPPLPPLAPGFVRVFSVSDLQQRIASVSLGEAVSLSLAAGHRYRLGGQALRVSGGNVTITSDCGRTDAASSASTPSPLTLCSSTRERPPNQLLFAGFRALNHTSYSQGSEAAKAVPSSTRKEHHRL